ncbi:MULTISPECIES: hypothetical protein [unclassified Leeuwenhoekiella]|uniref:hypothetical protein n=1 Tax=unclassified Leeuwenhoekiella TaxID=2615029 RepID=UPI000C4EF144|nr:MULTISPECIES: hypothetical protein [unclassified Leeuwenhoekiella]MAW95288.1 hypothetical protein [Leeuwenhoekiella sp.]MBA81789.1 hypothetical protein [Leeuwenhoekiella sp.]|tara:strand:+ start:3308 stop:3499 length:192 start_codon:yes stop_codon:yes gene_type:complete
MKPRIKIFTLTFIAVALFVFGFYYLDTHEIMNSVKLGVIGGVVVGAIAAILIPFVLKGHKQEH